MNMICNNDKQLSWLFVLFSCYELTPEPRFPPRGRKQHLIYMSAFSSLCSSHLFNELQQACMDGLLRNSDLTDTACHGLLTQVLQHHIRWELDQLHCAHQCELCLNVAGHAHCSCSACQFLVLTMMLLWLFNCQSAMKAAIVHCIAIKSRIMCNAVTAKS